MDIFLSFNSKNTQ